MVSNGNKIQSNAFRIRENVDGLNSSSSQFSQTISQLMAKICISSSEEILTLLPSYLEAVNESELFETLDQIMGKTIPQHSFLSNPASSSWLDLAKWACDLSEKEEATIPLYLLLILRFKLSILDSYQHCTVRKETLSQLPQDETWTSIDNALLLRMPNPFEQVNESAKDVSFASSVSDADELNEVTDMNQEKTLLKEEDKANGEQAKEIDQAITQAGSGGKKRKKKKKNKRKGAGVSQGQQSESGLSAPSEINSLEREQDKPAVESSVKEERQQGNDVEKDIKEASHKLQEAALKVVSSSGGVNASESNRDDTQYEVAKSQSKTSEKADSRSLESQKVEGNNNEVDNSTNDDDDGAWETVEVRSRANRKKASDRTNNGRSSSNQISNNNGSSSNGQSNNGSKKSKSSRGSKRQRSNNRKFVREILSSILDVVDDEVRQREEAAKNLVPSSNSWGPPLNGKETPVIKPSKQPKQLTLRDILVGGRSSATGNKPMSETPVPSGHTDQTPEKPDVDSKTNGDKGGKSKTTTKSKTVADQNTAPTVPETISALSAETRTRDMTSRDKGIVQSDSTSGDSTEPRKPTHGLSSASKETSSSPPLPTLLSPGNVYSTNSSVASSLDTSHAGHHSNHTSSNLGNEKDVGYHLLDVCDRLTRDINIFMKRREHALEIRRKERGSVLVALQDTLSSIWPGMCNVEMYGSCATELDLPSSDLDVVIRGLNKPSEQLASSSSHSEKSNEKSGSSEEGEENSSSDSPSGDVKTQQIPQKSVAIQPQMPPTIMYGHLSLNAERILRLAMELERQPWAVQVKAIPTASVPVIKILADPSRISGNGEWLMQHQIAAETSQSVVEQVEASGSRPNAMPQYNGHQNPPWRGADVMNGLLKVDITFEGPEHGGIGSTKFSSRVVKEFCDETGLSPEGTPAVQVLMVVKELLAQRRLNEPFSGGLSSYALLLLVISVLRERKFIREELERAEHQRKMVAEGGVESGLNSFSTAVAKQNDTKPKKTKATSKVEKTQAKTISAKNTNGKSESATTTQSSKRAQKGQKEQPKSTSSDSPKIEVGSSTNVDQKDSIPSVSSWASIAKKNPSLPLARKSSVENIQSNASKSESSVAEKPATQQQSKTVRKGSFADAVANGNKGGSKPANSGENGVQVKKKEKSPSNGKAKSKKASDAKAEVPRSAGESLVSETNSQQQGVVLSKQKVPSVTGESILSAVGTFPQGFHDVTEVLCSGETTPGKLLMHFLLFYGQHFDSQSTAIDYSGTHHRDAKNNNGYSQMSPYLLRQTAGSYDPMTGMLTVDPIVVYDPLEGAETQNVARSCFAWSSIRWVFAQSYLTLLSTVEINQNHNAGQNGTRGKQTKSTDKNGNGENGSTSELSHPWNGPYGHDKSGNMMIDPSSPLLELLLSF